MDLVGDPVVMPSDSRASCNVEQPDVTTPSGYPVPERSTTHPRLSFRSQLVGSVLDFLQQEGISCADTASAAVELIASLASYREEGVSLFPQVFICENVDRMVAKLGPQRALRLLGQGDRRTATVRDALKKCASLARGGWAIFIERTESGFRYGVFSASSEPLALSVSDLVLSIQESGFPIVLLAQLADNIVEVRGASGSSIVCHLSASEDAQRSPGDSLDALVASATGGVGREHREQVARRLQTVLTHTLQNCHGAIIAVTKTSKAGVPRSLRDGVPLLPPVSLLEHIKEYKLRKDAAAVAQLQAAEILISGMISSDGITLLRPDASVIAYRSFVKSNDGARATRVVGGARRRAFETLCTMVGKSLTAAFCRSQDGNSECKRSPHHG